MYKEDSEKEEILSKVIRAGRRTYFFDVRETRAGDFYLTITESKKTTHEDGTFNYRKHKIYLYKEDFQSFNNALKETQEFIVSSKGEDIILDRHDYDSSAENYKPEKSASDSLADLNFEDL